MRIKKMVQAELNSSTLKGNGLIITRKVYTKEYVDKKCKIWVKSRQLGFDGWPFCSYKHLEEIEWVKCAILDALNNPETFNARDNYAALCNLKDLIKGSKAEKLRSKYAVPVKLEYRNTSGVNCIVDVNHGDKLVVPLTAGELLDVIADLNKGRSVEDIFEVYDFYHGMMTIEYLEKFKALYCSGKLNKVIRFICGKSNDLGGFHDYGVGVIRNRLTSYYLFDVRRRGDD